MCGFIVDWPSWIQALAAIATLVIGWITYRSQRKIKTLTDVVENLTGIVGSLSEQTKELQNQTAVISKRYELEKSLSVRNRWPDFEVTNFYFNKMIEKWEMQLTNMGRFATSFLIAFERNIRSSYIVDYSAIKDTKNLVIQIQTDEKEMHKLEFEFSLRYKNGNGVWMDQKVFCFQGQVSIVPQLDSD